MFGPDVTLVATDVEGSTQLWEWDADVRPMYECMLASLLSHTAVLAAVIGCQGSSMCCKDVACVQLPQAMRASLCPHYTRHRSCPAHEL